MMTYESGTSGDARRRDLRYSPRSGSGACIDSSVGVKVSGAGDTVHVTGGIGPLEDTHNGLQLDVQYNWSGYILDRLSIFLP